LVNSTLRWETPSSQRFTSVDGFLFAEGSAVLHSGADRVDDHRSHHDNGYVDRSHSRLLGQTTLVAMDTVAMDTIAMSISSFLADCASLQLCCRLFLFD